MEGWRSSRSARVHELGVIVSKEEDFVASGEAVAEEGGNMDMLNGLLHAYYDPGCSILGILQPIKGPLY